MSDEHDGIDFRYDVHYANQVIKTFDDRREAIQYVDEFFDGVDDDRRENSIYIYCGDFVKIYAGFRLAQDLKPV